MCVCVCVRKRERERAHKDWVTDEEDGSVISHEVPVAILSVELDGKSSRVPHCVGTT